MLLFIINWGCYFQVCFSPVFLLHLYSLHGEKKFHFLENPSGYSNLCTAANQASSSDSTRVLVQTLGIPASEIISMWQRFTYQLDFETKQGIWVLSRASFPGKVDIWDAGGEKGGKSRLKLSEVRENWKSFKMSSDKDNKECSCSNICFEFAKAPWHKVDMNCQNILQPELSKQGGGVKSLLTTLKKLQ